MSKPNRVPMRFAALACGLAGWLANAAAHDQIPGGPQTKPIAIVGGTVHTVDGAVLPVATVVFENGLITAVGKNAKPPAGATVIDAKGQHVYPGMIESMSDIGLREISAVDVTVDGTERGSENPNVQALSAVNPDSELIPVARANGVLMAMTAPGGRWMRGQSAVIQLDGWDARQMTLRSPAGLVVDWGSMHPSDSDAKRRAIKREEKLQQLDDLLDSVRRYADARIAQPEQTPTDLRLESLIPVVRGELPLYAVANDQEPIESAVAYAQQQGLQLVIYGGYDAVECAPLLKRFDVPVIIASIYRLPRHRNDPYDASYTLPSRLLAAGVRFCIAGEGAGYPGGASNARNLPYHAATAVAYGLSREAALRAVTLSAAEILGVADRVGSLTPGKHATLFVATGDILETESNVTSAFIQGRVVDLNSRHTLLNQKYQEKARQLGSQ